MKVEPSYRVVTDRFFREQWKRKQTLRARIDEIWEQDWKGPSSYKGDLRHKFVADYREALEAAGAVEFDITGDLQRTRLNSAHTYTLSTYLLTPVSIGQRRDGESDDFYVEEMAMLMRAGARVSGKKASANHAPLCLLLSRHFLERGFERGAIETDMIAQLKCDVVQLSRKLAFALATGLVKTDFGEVGGQSAFVPYGDGLAMFASKILAGASHDENFGWKHDFVRGKHTRAYVKKDLVKQISKTKEARAEGKLFVQSWYAATFVSGAMLSKAQRRYVADFESVYGAVDVAEIDNCFDLWFNPDFVFRPDRQSGFDLTPELAKAFELLEESLGHEALKVHGKHPIMYFVPDGMDTKRLNGAQM